MRQPPGREQGNGNTAVISGGYFRIKKNLPVVVRHPFTLQKLFKMRLMLSIILIWLWLSTPYTLRPPRSGKQIVVVNVNQDLGGLFAKI
jgi:hypothetical protein